MINFLIFFIPLQVVVKKSEIIKRKQINLIFFTYSLQIFFKQDLIEEEKIQDHIQHINFFKVT